MKTLAQTIDEADYRWQHAIGNSGAEWSEYIAANVILWLVAKETTPTDIVSNWNV